MNHEIFDWYQLTLPVGSNDTNPFVYVLLILRSQRLKEDVASVEPNILSLEKLYFFINIHKIKQSG